ncbi:hypothetical protein [Ferruginibacter albus]|uniref:hypothetical protein n=1 Tax=Ferruginibacter albus TaxID=2875540 RepID=UPI001CC7362F|nr:hypothetical protein [Ferruginibacter albus]UAY53260.1 hypothetical protein K9M53_06205 [Ferruginibacter albus]
MLDDIVRVSVKLVSLTQTLRICTAASSLRKKSLRIGKRFSKSLIFDKIIKAFTTDMGDWECLGK